MNTCACFKTNAFQSRKITIKTKRKGKKLEKNHFFIALD